MDIILFLFTFIVALFSGVVLTLVVQWYLFNSYIMKQPLVGPATKPIFEPFSLPKCVSDEKSTGKEPAGALNALFQFLFQECRNTKRVRQWFRKRLSLELEELLTRTTTGKLFERIILRDLNLGSHLPAIHSVEVRTLTVDPGTKLIDEVELCLDLEYSGGFQLSIDASMRLSKAAHVSVKVNELAGQAMLKFTRNPYTHWCFCFYSDPMLQLSVESQFQGRSLPQVNSIIASQIRKALKKKHTLPHYKIRYKPFFVRMDLDTLEESEGAETPLGHLEVTIIEVTRLVDAVGPIFCSAAVDKLAWIEMVHSGTASYLTVDVALTKQSGQPFPVVFKQEFIPDKYQVCVVVESVQNNGVSELKTGDLVVMVDGKNITSLSSLQKIIRNTQGRLTFRVERRLKSVLVNDEKVENFGLRHRRSSVDKTDSDSSNPPSLSESPAKKSVKSSPDHSGKQSPRLSLGSDVDVDPNRPQVIVTKDVPYSKVITFNETLKFHIFPEHKYLNLSVWSRGTDKNTLLGHISLPLSTHCPKTVGHHISTFSLFPPNPNLANSCNHALSTHSGFEPCLCFGDALLSFSFKSTSTLVQSPPPVTITTPPETPLETMPVLQVTEHDFVRIHFDKVTQCGFCFKKIWLKDALQCQGCLMSCHKKCAPKCQAGSGCARSTRRPSTQPEIITTAAEENNSQASLVEGGLFSTSDVGGDEINQALELLLSRPHDEHVMDAAKASGKLLFADLPPDVRKSRIDNVMGKLKEAIDAESLNHQSLLREEHANENAGTKAKLAFLAGKSEERLQALTVLMLHCCAGLQDYQEALN